MQRNWLFQFLMIAVILLPWTGRLYAAEPATGGPYAHLEEMDAEARTAWVETMLQRLDESNQVVLAPEAVAKQRARFKEALASFVEGLPNWQSQVSRFEQELALSQRAATEHLIRRYRMDIYRAFRGNQTAFKKHRSLLEKLLTDWKNSKSPSSQHHKVVQWLIVATRDPSGSNFSQLPPLPKFEGKSQPLSAKRALAQSDSLEPRRIPPMPSTARILIPSTVSEVELPTTVTQSPKISLHGPQPATFLASRVAGSIDSNTVRPAAFYSPPRVELPLAVHRSIPRPHHIAMQPSLEPSGFVDTLKPKMVAHSSPKTGRRPTSVASITRPIVKNRPRIASRTATSPNRSSDPLAFARTKVDRLTMVSTQKRYGVSHDTSNEDTAQASQDNYPTITFPQNSPSDDISTSNSFANNKHSKQQSVTTTTPNMEELAARIQGNNVALRKLTAQLYEERGWDAKSLTAILDQLEPLVARKDDLKLIRELIPPEHRDRVGDLETGSDLISGLGTKIAKVRSTIEQDKKRSNAAARKRELNQLDKLSQKLANLVFSE